MSWWTWLLPLALVIQVIHIGQQRARIARLGVYLRRHPIEEPMAQLMSGLMAALDQPSAAQRDAAWRALAPLETDLNRLLRRLALDIASLPEPLARLSRMPLGLPWATQWAAQCVDLRKLIALHAHAIERACLHGVRSPAQRAHTLLAELMLLQHTCHWYCRSQLVAQARLVARHHTSTAQVIDAVDAQTRRDYRALLAPSAASPR